MRVDNPPPSPSVPALARCVPRPEHVLLCCVSIGSWLDQETPFGRLAKRVFFGDSDAFRDERLKLIPKVSAASVSVSVSGSSSGSGSGSVGMVMLALALALALVLALALTLALAVAVAVAVAWWRWR